MSWAWPANGQEISTSLRVPNWSWLNTGLHRWWYEDCYAWIILWRQNARTQHLDFCQDRIPARGWCESASENFSGPSFSQVMQHNSPRKGASSLSKCISLCQRLSPFQMQHCNSRIPLPPIRSDVENQYQMSSKRLPVVTADWEKEGVQKNEIIAMIIALE